MSSRKFVAPSLEVFGRSRKVVAPLFEVFGCSRKFVATSFEVFGFCEKFIATYLEKTDVQTNSAEIRKPLISCKFFLNYGKCWKVITVTTRIIISIPRSQRITFPLSLTVDHIIWRENFCFIYTVRFC